MPQTTQISKYSCSYYFCLLLSHKSQILISFKVQVMLSPSLCSIKWLLNSFHHGLWLWFCLLLSLSPINPLKVKVPWSANLTEADGLTDHTCLHKHFFSFLRWGLFLQLLHDHLMLWRGSAIIATILLYLQFELYKT